MFDQTHRINTKDRFSNDQDVIRWVNQQHERNEADKRARKKLGSTSARISVPQGPHPPAIFKTPAMIFDIIKAPRRVKKTEVRNKCNINHPEVAGKELGPFQGMVNVPPQPAGFLSTIHSLWEYSTVCARRRSRQPLLIQQPTPQTRSQSSTPTQPSKPCLSIRET